MKRIAALIGLSLILAACGVSVTTESGVGESTQSTVMEPVETTTPASTLPEPVATDFPASVLTGAGEVVIEQRPEAIISLSPTATEMLFAVGAGDQVIAVDEYSTFPAAAPVTDLSGFTPNMEAIASYGPDLVIVSNDIEDIIATLGALDIQVLLMPAVTTIEGVFDQIDEIGIATGHRTEAAELIEGLSADFASAVAGLPALDEPLTYYHELDPTFYSVTSSTFVGGVYGELRLENIADPADVDGFGYPQLSVEFIIEADPDLIFVTDCCGESLETVSSRAGWENLSAVQSGSVFVVDDDIASRWGPRTIEFLQSVADAVASAVSG